ncbi:MAG: hypothetical protein HW403_1440, partial [Dehalococcoidia bacterium]|nr:hypothetical protein [Dehalococcoidia bacterium]
FKSTNAGSKIPTWQRVNQGLEPEWAFVRAITLSPRFPDDRTLFVGTDNGIFKGVEQPDGKIKWTVMNRGLQRKDVRVLAVSPNLQIDHVAFAAVRNNDLYRLQNGGDTPTWVPQRKVVGNLWNWSVGLTREGVLMAGTWGLGLARSFLPGGEGWSYPTLPGAPGAEVTTVAVSPTFCSGYSIFAGTWAHGLFKSIDGGASWSWVSGYPTTASVRAMTFSPKFQQDGTAYVASWGYGVYVTRDGGATWSTSNAGLTDLRIRTVAVSPNYPDDPTVFAGTEGAGVFRWDQSLGRWVKSGQGISVMTIMDLAASPNYGSDGSLYAATWGGGIYRSSDLGSSWSPSSSGVVSPFVRSLTFSPAFASDGTLYAATHEGLYQSRDRGANWSLLPSLDGELDKIDITDVALSPSQPATLFVSTGGRGVWQLTHADPSAQVYTTQEYRDLQSGPTVFFPSVSKQRPGGPCID